MGRVVTTNEKVPKFLGAAKGTNNTGELSAIHRALTHANEVLPLQAYRHKSGSGAAGTRF